MDALRPQFPTSAQAKEHYKIWSQSSKYKEVMYMEDIRTKIVRFYNLIANYTEASEIIMNLNR